MFEKSSRWQSWLFKARVTHGFWRGHLISPHDSGSLKHHIIFETLISRGARCLGPVPVFAGAPAICQGRGAGYSQPTTLHPPHVFSGFGEGRSRPPMLALGPGRVSTSLQRLCPGGDSSPGGRPSPCTHPGPQSTGDLLNLLSSTNFGETCFLFWHLVNDSIGLPRWC